MTLLRRPAPADKRSSAGGRFAFTLVELLVVTAVTSSLIAIVLPALQSAREAARRVQCKNNLKQLALSALNHHNCQGHFPTGGWGWYWLGDPDRGFGKDQPGGWMFNLLPYCEQDDLHAIASDAQPYILTREQRVGAARVVESPLTILNCPSRRQNTTFPLSSHEGGTLGFFNSNTPLMAGRGDYAINSGHVYCEWRNADLGRGPASYADAEIWTANRTWGSEQTRFLQLPDGSETMTGVSYERSKVAMRQVADGLAHTYLIAERYIPQAEYETGANIGDNETWCTGFNNDNYRSTGCLVGKDYVIATPSRDSTGAGDDTVALGRFGSAHADGWNAALCDGSVHSVSYDISPQVHRNLGHREDGATIGAGSF